MSDHDDRGDNVRSFPGAPPATPASSSKPPPPGKIEQIVTYLEMRRAPPHRLRTRLEQTAIMAAREPTLSFYRYLYDTVGAPWLWWERRVMGDEDLAAIIHHPKVRIYVLYVNGVPAGYSELDLRVDDEVDLAYFGLIEEFIGRGLGQYFLDWTVAKAWESGPERVHVHTCDHDHPKAIAVYQRAGFKPVRQERIVIDDPRTSPA